MRGKFIVLCGTDGSGKATQQELLVKKLKQEGFDVETADFPQYGRSFFAELVKRYLNGEFGSADEVDPVFASLLYAGDRFEAKDQIKKWLSEAKVVVSNRYVSANKAHQGGKIKDKAKREEFLKWIDELEFQTFKIPVPDLNIFLNVPYEIGQELVDKKGKRDYTSKKRDIHEQDKEHLKNAYNVYMEMAEKYENWVKVDCVKDGKLLDPEPIAEKVFKIVNQLMHS